MIQRMRNFEGVIGEDLPYKSQYYEDIPEGFGFSALKQHDDTPLTATVWDSMIRYCEEFYHDWEINGATYVDFQRRLQLAYDEQADTFERLMEVYHDDIAKPILGRTEKVTYDLINEGETNTEDTSESTKVPADIPASDVADDRNQSRGKNTGKNTQKGTTTTELSDLGVRPNYESLNGFLDANRTSRQVFCDMFRDCFIIFEGIIF